MIVILLDPGHGGKDFGAKGNGLIEKDLNLKIAKYLKSWLGITGGLKTYMTRTSDTYVPLNISRTSDYCDISISIHCNAGGGQGLETWVALYNKPTESKVLGEYIHRGILSKVPFVDRCIKTRKSLFVKRDYYYMLRKPVGIPVLVECGFVDNKYDAEILKSEKYLEEIAKGICKGIKDYKREVEILD